MLRSLGSRGAPDIASAGELARARTAAARLRIRQLIMVALSMQVRVQPRRRRIFCVARGIG